MATNFPSSQDTFTNPTTSDTLASVSHSQQHADVNDAVEALEAKVGVDSSTVSSSLDYRVAALEQTSGRRNLLYNGAMQVNQRGETASSLGTASGNYFTADRWLWRNSGNMGTWTNTTEVDAPDGFEKSFKTTCVTADASPASGDLLAVQQRIEGADLQHLKWGTSSAEQVTLSFWVKSNVTGTYAVPLEQPISGGGFKYVTLEYTINSSATWEHKVLTFPANTVASMLNTTGIGLTVWFLLGAHSFYTGGSPQSTWGDFQTSGSFGGGQVNLASTVGNYWQVTGVQLEVGDKATRFEWRPYGEELALCQRYYTRFTRDAGFQPVGGAGIIRSATDCSRVTVDLPTTMRVNGNSSNIEYSNMIIWDGNLVQTISSFSLVQVFQNKVSLDCTASGMTNSIGVLLTNNASGAYFAVNTEL